jgi:hypothetical protein
MKTPKDTSPKYFAVPDPDTGDMTYWYTDHRGRLSAWPSKLRNDAYGPTLWTKPGPNREHIVPDGLTERERGEWIKNWFETVRQPWMAKIRAAIDADRDACLARFAAFASRCCCCGKTLTDAASKAYGIGPDCRAGLPPEVLEACARAMGRVHGQSLADAA